MPARRRVANRPSRNWGGISRRRASSPIGTGTDAPHSVSSQSARTAYGDLEVMASKRAKVTARGTRIEARSLGPSPGADGADLLPLPPARPVVGARSVGHDRAQDHPHGRVRAALRALVARARAAPHEP